MEWDGIITISILIIVIGIIYSKLKKQSMKDTFDQVKELFTGGTKE